jgi:UDP-N-acetylmuramate--alanine ligase
MLRDLDLSRPIHFVGIGGSSMSGLAMTLHQLGYRVTGSDLNDSPNVQQLRNTGIPAAVGHAASNLPRDAQLVVVTTASIRTDNPELVAAHAQPHTRIVDRAALLGALMQRHERGVAIAGTRGKTTTTAIIAHILKSVGADPSVSIGTAVTESGGNFSVGSGPHFIAEACEYHRAFLHLNPYMALVLNIGADHGDYFTGPADIHAAFQSFVERVQPGGELLVSADFAPTRALGIPNGCQRVTFGFDADADYRIRTQAWIGGLPTFTITHPAGVATIRAGVAGRHNIANIAAAFAAAIELGIPSDTVIPAIETFRGAPRRLQRHGAANGIQVYDDLACTPREITATMTALRGLAAGAKITVVLRPNSYTRVRDYLTEYAPAFTDAEDIVLTDIYPGRDTDTYGVSAADLVKEFRRLGRPVRHVADLDGKPDTAAIIARLNRSLDPGDVLVTIGPHDIADLGPRWLSAQRTPR